MLSATPARLSGEHSSTAECAAYAGVDPQTWLRWSRTRPGFPQIHRFGPRTIRFKTAEVLAFLEQEQQSSTSAVGV